MLHANYISIKLEEKEKEVLIHGITWMDLENIMLSEISKTQKEKY